MNQKIQTILNEYAKRKAPDKRVQKAELLLGNHEFLAELKKYRHPDDEEILRLLGFSSSEPKNKAEKLNRTKLLSEAHHLLWSEFCDRWNISSKWNGKPGTLAENLRGAVRFGIIERQSVGQKEIFISLDESATQTEVRNRWDEIEKLQNRILAGKLEEKPNFKRNLCWYQLKTNAGMKVSEIANLWIKQFREEVELLVLQRLKQNESVLKNRTEDDRVLLKDIKTGMLSEEVKESFQADWNDYVNTETLVKDKEVVKRTSPFEDMLGKAVRRMRDEFKRPMRFPTQKMPLKMTYLN